jgi:hypothetical protein
VGRERRRSWLKPNSHHAAAPHDRFEPKPTDAALAQRSGFLEIHRKLPRSCGSIGGDLLVAEVKVEVWNE